MKKVIRVCLGGKLALVRFLNEILIALLLCKQDRILPCFKAQMSTLHVIGRRLPAHERVLPSMAFLQTIPVHPPMMTMPSARLGCRFRRSVDSTRHLWLARNGRFFLDFQLPYGSSLKVRWCSGEYCGSYSLTRFTAIHHPFWDGREGPVTKGQ